MTDPKSLAQLLRTADVFQDETPQDETSQAEGDSWRTTLSEQFEQPVSAVAVPGPESVKTPLQWHHVSMMAPAGAGLFLAGILVGGGAEFLEKMGSVSPLTWVVGAGVSSLGFLIWRRKRNWVRL